MMNRKLSAVLIAATLVVGVAGTTLADHNTTVPGAVYSDGHAKGFNKDHGKIKEDLAKAGVKDVSADHWAAGSISVLVEAGLLSPDANGSIAPDSTVSAEEGVAIFAKVLGIASKTDSAATAAAKAKEAGIADNTTGPMTRLGVAKLLAKALGVQPKVVVSPAQFPFNDYQGIPAEDMGILAALYEMGIFKGYPDKTFKPGETLTKAQIAILVDRILGGQ